MKEELLKLSLPQQNIMGMEQYFEGGNMNNIATRLHIEKIETNKMQQAIQVVVEHCETLHLIIDKKWKETGFFRQSMRENKQYFTQVVSCEKEDDEKFRNITEQFVCQPLNIYERLFAFKIVLFGDGDGILLVKLHHLISDAWSQVKLQICIIDCYEKLCAGRHDFSFPESYKNYLELEKKYLSSQKYKGDESFWQENLKQEFEPATLRTVSGVRDNVSKRHSVELSEKETALFCQMREKLQVSPFTLIITLIFAYTARSMRSQNIAIGTPVLNRGTQKEKHTLGVFINTIPLILHLENHDCFSDLCKKVTVATMYGFTHQRYPFSKIQKQAKENGGSGTLFDVLVSYQNVQSDRIHGEWLFNGSSQQQISVHVSDYHQTKLRFDYDYQMGALTEKDIEFMHGGIFTMLEDACAHPEHSYLELPILSEQEQQELDTFQCMQDPQEQFEGIASLFAKRAKECPERNAIVTRGSKIIYKELESLSNRIARSLAGRGVKTGDIVAMMLSRTEKIFACQMGILKAGAAYLPIDVEFPEERIAYILEDSKAKYIIVEQEQSGEGEQKNQLLYEELSEYPDDTQYITEMNTDDMCYMIYTSGSTGRPKGTMVSHGNVYNYCKYHEKNVYGHIIKELPCTILSVTTISFDIFVTESMLPLVNGMTILLADEKESSQGAALAELLETNTADVIQTTPSKLGILIHDKENYAVLKNLKLVILGGEPIDPMIVRKVRRESDAKVFNIYGPTETTVWSTVTQPLGEENYTIGSPIAGTQVHIVDEQKQRMPLGTIGELCIAGAGVCLGYYRQEELTEQRFEKNPFGQGKIYHTGDYARWNHGGELEFVGRADAQIKLHGLRIELGEIENCISAYDGIEMSAAVVRGSGAQAYICGFFTAKQKVHTDELKRHLSRQLTSYMVPNVLVQLESMPYTNNGKIARNQLPEVVQDSHLESPETPREEQILEILKECMGTQLIGATTELFTIGMTSLDAIKISSAINKTCKIELPVKEVLRNSSVRLLATDIDKRAKKTTQDKGYSADENALKGNIPLTESQMGLYMIWLKNKEAVNYNFPVVYRFQSDIDPVRLAKAVKAAIHIHPYMKTYFKEEKGKIVALCDEKQRANVAIMTKKQTPTSFVRPFDLNKAPLYQVKIYSSEEETLLYFDIHHILFDGASAAVFINDIKDAYENHSCQRVGADFSMYAYEELTYKNSAIWEEDRAYFETLFEGAEAPTQIQPDIRSMEKEELAGKTGEICFPLQSEWKQKVSFAAKENSVTLMNYLLAAFSYALAKMSGNEDIRIGTVEDGRNELRFQRTVGMLVKTLPIRIRIEQQKTVAGLLAHVKTIMQECQGHDQYSLQEFVKKFQFEPEILFIYQNVDFMNAAIDGNQAQILELGTREAKYHISFSIEQNQLKIEYRLDKYTQKYMSTLAEMFFCATEQLSHNQKGNLNQIELLTSGDYKALRRLNDTQAVYDHTLTMLDLFEKAVRENPDKVAVYSGNNHITYTEMAHMANYIAHNLAAKGIKKGDIVSIAMRRTDKLLCMIMGILKAGAAYLPMDIEWPKDRMDYVNENAGAVLCVNDGMAKQLCQKPLAQAAIERPTAEDLCYIIYTSGSTGQPKGGMISHQNLVNFSLPLPNNYAIKETKDRCSCALAIANIAFDAAVHETIATLVNGVSVAFADEKTLDSPKRLAHFIKKTNAECMLQTPSRLLQFLKDETFCQVMSQMKIIISAAEVYPEGLYHLLKKNKKTILLNGYGPSETTIGTSYSYVTKVPAMIGTPMSNVQVFILDSLGNRLPKGVVGELCVCGDSVGKGYLNNPELTARKFVKNPWGRGLLYHTGDKARLGYHGELEFFGRMDDQIKLHGLRIEIGEVEAVMHSFEGITQSVAVVAGQGSMAFLCGYFTAKHRIKEEELREYLLQKLSYYMVPNRLIQLLEFPLTPNGKLNYKALREVENEVEWVPLKSAMQKSIGALVSEVLEVEQVGLTTNLYELGMTSLHAISLNAKLCSTFQFDISSKELLRCNTVKAIELLVRSYKKEQTWQELIGECCEEYPLTMNQKGIYYEYKLDPSSLTYNVLTVYRFGSETEIKSLKGALSEAIKAHPYLNSYVKVVNGEPALIRGKETEPEIKVEQYKEEILSEFLQPFCLEKAPLYRVALYQGQNEIYMLLDVHHIIFDGESLYTFLSDVMRSYAGEEITRETVSAYEYALYEKKQRKGEQIKEAKKYYQKLLSGVEQAASIPADIKLGEKTASYVMHSIPSQITTITKQLASQYKISAGSVYFTAFLTALSKFARNRDLFLATIESGREHSELLHCVGMFVKTIPYRYQLKEQESFFYNAKAVQETLYDVIGQDLYSYAEVISDCKVSPEIVFIYQNRDMDGFCLNGQQGEVVHVESKQKVMPKFPISVNIIGTQIGIEFDGSKYQAATMEKLAQSVINCLQYVIKNPQALWHEIELISAEEKAKIEQYNLTTAETNPRATMVSVWEEQVRLHSEHLALVAGGQSLTYRQMDLAANRIANALIARGVCVQDIVALKLTRNSALLTAALGVLKVGAAYLPMDNNYPRDRIQYILQDSKATFVIDDENVKELLLETDEASPIVNIAPQDLCYVIYTSGSTGKPKGVMTEHRNVLNYCLPLRYNYHIQTICQECSVSLAVGSFAFDIATAEIYPFIFAGKTVVLASEEEANDPESLAELIEKHGADAILCTPSRMLQYVENKKFAQTLTGFHSISAAGESVPFTWVKKLRKLSNAVLYNGYGPTETTAGSTFLKIAGDYVNIGHPLSNEKVYVLDEFENPLPIGVSGELCITGSGVARGYLYREELTHQKFVPNPFGEGKMYHTGDLTRWNEYGEIEYLGRMDEQVKFHGFRIELGEIEARMNEHPLVTAAAVLLKNKNNNQFLCGYYTTENILEAEELRGYLSETLAYYMVPAVFVQLEEMPLNLNAKIDRTALPDAEYENGDNYVEPKTEYEIKICGIFGTVLNQTRLGSTDNFFEKGGDSLNSIYAAALAEKEGMSISARDILKYPTPRKLGEKLESSQKKNDEIQAEQGELTGEIPAGPIQQWFLESNFERPDYFNQSFLFETNEPIKLASMRMAMEELLKKHDALRVILKKEKMEYVAFHPKMILLKRESNVSSLQEIMKQAQETLSLKEGKLLSVVIISDQNKHNYFFLTIHHLAIDGVSWRILAQDLAEYYQIAQTGGRGEKCKKKTSTRQWVQALVKYEKQIKEETIMYWEKAMKAESALPLKPNVNQLRTMSSAAHKSVRLSVQDTNIILQKGRRRFGANANVLLLGTVISACRKMSPGRALVVNLEGHGREYIEESVDVSQTVGWFTSLFPLAVPLGESSVASSILDVRERLSTIPDNGLSYGILRYLSGHLSGELKKSISFNYLGQTQEIQDGGVFRLGKVQPASTIAPENQMTDAMSINGLIKHRRLELSIDYDSNILQKDVGKEFIVLLQQNIKELIALLTEEEQYYPLLQSQRGIYLSHTLEPESVNYNEPSEYIITDAIDVNRLKESFVKAVWAHPSMMVNIIQKDGELFQYVNQKNKPVIPCFEMSEEEYEGYKEQFVRPFAIAEEPLYRIAFVHVKNEIKILFDIHHIIYDRTSAAILIDTVNRCYLGEKVYEEQSGCFEAAVEEIVNRGTPEYEKARLFFRERFEGMEIETVLPFDHTVKRGETIPGDICQFPVPEDLVALARGTSRQQGVTENTIYLSALQICLAEYTGQKQVVLGTVSTGRNEEQYFNSVGMFVKTLPLNIEINHSETVLAFMRKSQENLISTMAHDMYAFSDMVSEFGLGRQDGRNPVFDILYVFQNTQEAKAQIGGVSFEVHEMTKTDSKFDLTFMAVPIQNEMELVLEYNAAMYEPETIASFVDCYLYTLRQMLEKLYESLEHLSFALPEQVQTIQSFNCTNVQYQQNLYVPQLLERLEQSDPLRSVLTACDGVLTVKELNEKANRVAQTLLLSGYSKNDVIALLLPRNASLIIAMLGVVRAGAAYLPLDIEYPKSRIDYLLEDAKVACVLTNQKIDAKYHYENIIDVETAMQYPDSGLPQVMYEEDDLFCLLHTSGSTGKPKCAMLSNKNMSNFVQCNGFLMDNLSAALAVTTVTFDAFTMDIFLSLCNGVPVILASEEECTNQIKLEKLIESTTNSYMFATPTRLTELLKNCSNHAIMEHIAIMVVGGELFKGELYDLIRQSSPNTRILNIYGPTETTIFATSMEVTSNKEINIGYPSVNTQIHILDSQGRMVPTGAVGELYVAGNGVGLGYRNNEELTGGRYLNSPFGKGMMYRTGDLAVWKRNGSVDFIGRMDMQVKFHGQRIELGEIEHCMNVYPGITASVVVIKQRDSGTYLCGYYTTNQEVSEEALREYLEEQLPYYMIPAMMMEVPQMPHTTSGKIDRRELPEISHLVEVKPCVTQLQEEIKEVILQVLSIQDIGRNTDLYACGMTSLSAIRMNAMFSSKWNTEIKMKEILQNSSIEKLEKLIIVKKDDGLNKLETVRREKRKTYPVTPNQMGLYLEYVKNPKATNYNVPMLYEFDLSVNAEQLAYAIKQAIAAHEYLNTVFRETDQGIIQMPLQRSTEVPILTLSRKKFEEYVSRFVQPFDLSEGPLYRLVLVRTKTALYLCFDVHHIIYDGESSAIFMESVRRAFAGEKLPKEVHTSYELAIEEVEEKGANEYNEAKEFFRNILGEIDGVSHIECAMEEEKVKESSVCYVRTAIDPELEKKIEKIGRENNVTRNHICMSAFCLLISRYTYAREVGICTITSARDHAHYADNVGMMVKTLPFAIVVNKQGTVGEWLEQFKKRFIDTISHDSYPYMEAVSQFEMNFEIMFSYQNHDASEIMLQEKPVKIKPMVISKAKFPISFDMTGNRIEIEYDSVKYSQSFMEIFAQSYLNLLKELVQESEKPISELQIVNTQERRMIETFNERKQYYDRSRTLGQLFEEQVTLHPEKPALAAADVVYSFREVNEKANRIAHGLLLKGVKPNDVVAFKLPRKADLFFVLWGILKAGAAYLPLDMEYPKERIDFVLEDSAARFLIVQEPEGRNNELLCEELLACEDQTNPVTWTTSEDLCYVIYTSGSTGTPKGVMIQHKNVSNYAQPLKYNEFVNEICSSCDSSLAICTVAFDIFCCEVFTITLNGKLFVFADEEEVNNGALVGQLIERYQIGVMQYTPSRLLQYMEDETFLKSLHHLKLLVVGAEVFPSTLLKRLEKYTNAKVFNAYGPTETTIGTTFIEITGSRVTIGKPLTNTQIYITDLDFNLLPAGVTGELCIAGYGVGKGYLRRPELTAEKFVKNPFGKGYLYHSGDLARWNMNGEVEYAGRIDHQVKLNGLRIELGEIETRINEYPGITACCVRIKESGGRKFLCAYYTAAHEVNESDVKEKLAEKLVYYMIPPIFRKLEHMPVTLNGKVDQRALPEVEFTYEGSFVRPFNEKQAAICQVYQEVLDIKQVGIDDSFFDLGGDSIKGIQVSSRLLHLGYRMKMRQIFEAPTSRQLEAYLESVMETSDNREVAGSVELTPIQRFFFEQNFQEKHQWNQSVTLVSSQVLEQQALDKTFQVLIELHDVLRMQFSAEEAVIASVKQANAYKVIPAASKDFEQAIKHASQSLNLEKGPLMNVVYTNDEAEKRLFITIHHLVVDGVTWRILLEDINTAYVQALAGAEIILPDKTTSYQTWSKAVLEYARSQKLRKEEAYWRDVHNRNQGLPSGYVLIQPRVTKELVTETFELSKEETKQLVSEANHAYQTEINDLLLSALAKTNFLRFGVSSVSVLLEGHGREDISNEVNVSRTAGWFTSTYPVLLCGDDQFDKLLPQNKENLRNVPMHGIGHDILKYVVQPREIQFKDCDIQFNYLGEFNTASRGKDSPYFSMKAFGSRYDIAPTSPVNTKLQISGAIMEGHLICNVTYDQREYQQNKIARYAREYKKQLIQLIKHCVEKRTVTYTPSDFGWEKLSLEEYETLLNVAEIKPDEIQLLYPITKIQEGMLRLSQMFADQAYYHEQVVYRIKGALDEAALTMRLENLTARHDALRSIFVWENLKEPYLIVQKKGKTEISFVDLSEYTAKQQEDKIKDAMKQDRNRGFDMKKAPLFRIVCYRLGKQEAALFIAFSHILLDKWSFDRLITEFLTGTEEKKTPGFLEYVKWLYKQEKADAFAYYQEQFRNCTSETNLPIVQKSTGETGAQKVQIEISEDVTVLAETYCREQEVTFSTFVLYLWGKILHKANAEQPVVFGYTMSGRPNELPDVEKMIGMFINTLPVCINLQKNVGIATQLKNIQKQMAELEKFMYLPIGEIQKQIRAKHRLFNHFLTYQNTPRKHNEDGAVSGMFDYNRSLQDFSVSISRIPENGLQFLFQFDAGKYLIKEVEILARDVFNTMKELLAEVVNKQKAEEKA